MKDLPHERRRDRAGEPRADDESVEPYPLNDFLEEGLSAIEQFDDILLFGGSR